MIGQALFFRRLRRWLLVGGSVFLCVGFVGNVAVVEYTTQPQFCGTCHNMTPYVDSWKRSPHKNVACIDCHYDPGILETLEGKYKALSQLAKYATRTAGTKPWAEVTDASCMRSGCHETRLLSGRIPFGAASFDHRPHLLDTRPGKRLHCTTCHAQVDQADHISVTKSTCYTCHFTPAEGQAALGREGVDACVLCHEAPAEDVLVADRPFSHAEYVGKHGVDCRSCHDDVTRGEGAVSRDRCKQCHGEVEYMERFEQPVFLHQAHVTDSKVECFECHGEIQHGLAPREQVVSGGHGRADGTQTCASCHGASHSLQGAMFAGQVDGEDLPSRMHETRVACRACHAGDTAEATGAHADGARLPRATEVGCFGCHGVEFAGMLGAWTESTAATLAELDARAATVAALTSDSQPPPVRDALAEARRRLDLVRNDGSGGAHNLALTRRLLDKAGQDLARALGLLGQPAPAVSVGPAIATERGCTTACHSQLDTLAVTTAEGRSFSHRAHLLSPERREQVGDCDRCHDVTRPPGQPDHGQRVVTPQDCAQCHHDGGAEKECADCHDGPRGWLAAELSLVESPPTTGMDRLECADCHEAPPAGEPWSAGNAMRACATCHEGEDDVLAGFDAAAKGLHDSWATLEARARLAAVREAQRVLGPEQLAALERARVLMRRTAQGGLMHNQALSRRALDEAAAELKTVLGED